MSKKKEQLKIFTEEDCKKLEILATCCTLEEIATHFDIGMRTMDMIRERQPEVDAAYKKGAANVKLRATSKLMRYIDNPELNQVNLTATIFYLKTKGGWVDASKFIEREMVKVRRDLVDIKTIEDPKEFLNKIDKAVAHIDFLMKKEVRE
jgi:hypothetical protein